MAKTYIPTLLVTARQLCQYITRYRETILKYIPETAKDEFNSLANACEAFLDAMVVWDGTNP